MDSEEEIRGEVIEIPNAENDAKIKEIAQFAVAEYKNIKRTNVEFVRVVKASSEKVLGMYYFPTIEVVYRGNKVQCEAHVWEVSYSYVPNMIRLEKFAQCKNGEQSSSLISYEVANPKGTCSFGDMCSCC